MYDYKLAVINNNDEIIKKGSINDGDLHINCLLNYIKENYSDNDLLTKLNNKHTPDTAAYYLTLFDNNILFLNTTHDVDKYGRTGVFFMPSNILDSQRKKLEEFVNEVDDYSVDIAYDFKIEDGFLNAQELRSSKAGDLRELLTSYFDKIKNVKTK